MNDPVQIRALLEKEGMVLSTSVGVSMWPMLRNRRDTVLIHPLKGRLKKYDVALYTRNGQLILHRVLRVWPDGYDIRGDNCLGLEKNVSEDCMLGVLAGFWRGERKVNMSGLGYRLYVRLWCFVFPVRALLKRLRGRLMGFAARIWRNKTKN